MDSEKIVKERKQKIFDWFKDRENHLLVGILLFAFILRLYYTFITQGQALWWDEAVYMNMARTFSTGEDLGFSFSAVRPVLFPLIIAGFMKISSGEFLPRFLIFIISMASVLGIFFLGKILYNKKVGLVSSFIMAVFYLGIFHTSRLLVDLPSMTFFVFSAIFFYRYLLQENEKDIYIATLIVGIGTLFRITTSFILIIFIIHILITKRLKVFRKKEIWIASIIFWLILAPYIIWGYSSFGGFIITMAGEHNAPKSDYLQNGIENLSFYLPLLPKILFIPLFLLFLLGIFLTYRLFLGGDLLLKKGNQKIKRDLFILLILLIPIFLPSFLQANPPEDRYIIGSFVAIIILASNALIRIYDYLRKEWKVTASIFLIFILAWIAFTQLQYADNIIQSKKGSYLPVKDAGIWAKQNLDSSAVVFTISHEQMRYYYGRETRFIPKNKTKFEEVYMNYPSAFLIVSIFEPHHEWLYGYSQEKNLSIVKSYLDKNKNPLLIIYKLR